VLDVGSGTGYLQDAVEDYTGIDISRSAARYSQIDQADSLPRVCMGTYATALPPCDPELPGVLAGRQRCGEQPR